MPIMSKNCCIFAVEKEKKREQITLFTNNLVYLIMKRSRLSHVSFDESQVNTICMALSICRSKLLNEMIESPDDLLLAQSYADVIRLYSQFFELRKHNYWNK